MTSGILLQGGDQVRHDVAMEVGALTETVEVRSTNEGLSDTRPDVSHTVNEKSYRDLPIVTAADVRLAEAVLQIQPGYLPMKPNGDPMFRGSQFNSRINGGQARATENVFDGAAFGYAVGHQESHESTPPVEAIQEVKVITTSYSAQRSHERRLHRVHVQVGHQLVARQRLRVPRPRCVQRQRFFARGKTPLQNDNFGFAIGGPVVMGKLYNGRNKTFFFTNLDWTRFRSGVLPGFGNTTPIDAFKAGDFSALLTGNQIGVDALGRPIMGGQIFDPPTTRLVNGVPVRDAFPNNAIPANDPLRSQVAARIAPLMVRPDRAGTASMWRATRRATRRGSSTRAI